MKKLKKVSLLVLCMFLLSMSGVFQYQPKIEAATNDDTGITKENTDSEDEISDDTTEDIEDDTSDDSEEDEIVEPVINKSKITLYVGKSITLEIENTLDTIKWKSSNKEIATVNSEGKVTAKKKGTTTITATISEYELTCKVTVKNPTLNKSKAILSKGESITLKVANGSGTVKWTSSNKSVATVSTKGKVTAKKNGTVTITANVSGLKLTCKVTVKTLKPDFDAITIDTIKPNATLCLIGFTNNGTKTLTISGKDSYLFDNDYESNDRALYIADASNGFKKISSVSIKAGKSKYVCFLIDGTSTWYDAKSTITYTVKYDGKSYVYGTSSYYGTSELLNN